jgi:hypothetical protein
MMISSFVINTDIPIAEFQFSWSRISWFSCHCIKEGQNSTLNLVITTSSWIPSCYRYCDCDWWLVNSADAPAFVAFVTALSSAYLLLTLNNASTCVTVLMSSSVMAESVLCQSM